MFHAVKCFVLVSVIVANFFIAYAMLKFHDRLQWAFFIGLMLNHKFKFE